MARKIPTEALAKLVQATGLDPVNIIRIQWVKDGGYFYYSDRHLPDQSFLQGKLISLADIEAVLNIDKSGTSTTVKVELDDTDGTIKDIFDNNDINNRPVVIYQWFDEADFSINYMFPIFEGAIATPIQWDEGSRVFSFDIMTSLEDREVGFSVEDGDFTNVPDLLLGKPWPLVFGTVLDMPTVRMDDMPTGTTMIPLSIPDYSVSNHIDYMDQQTEKTLAKAGCLGSRAAELMREYNEMRGDFGAGNKADLGRVTLFESGLIKPTDYDGRTGIRHYYTKDEVEAINKQRQADEAEMDKEAQHTNSHAQQLFQRSIQLKCQAYQMIIGIQNKINPQIEQLRLINERQRKYDTDVIPIINGHLFRQGQELDIKINNAIFTGSFQGDNFMVVAKTAPKDIKRDNTGNGFGTQIPIVQQTFVYSSSCDNKNNAEDYWSCARVGDRDDPTRPTKQASSPKEPWFAQAGATVNIGNNYPIRYILSIMPNTTVLWLSAKSTINNLKVITPIPPEYYTISTLNLGSITATIATFTQPLNTIEDQDWENDVYATLQSNIGPNVIDILTWLIQTYTVNSIDTVSFNYVRTKLLNYPANFALLEKKNVIDLLREISWQSRCSIWIADGIFYIKYLPEQAAPVDTITESDIELSTLRIATTPTEDLVTKFIATWQSNYGISEKNKVILTYNINKYGVKERTFDFYIYNTVELVEKSATFWLIRMANMWKKLLCQCFLTKLIAETMDNITVDLAHHSHANVSVIGVVEKATFNSTDYSIDMDVWLPVRIGEMTPYDFAYPANISTQLLFPTIKDIAGGFVNDIPQAQGATGDLKTVQPSLGGPSHGNKTQSQPADAADKTRPDTLPPIITTGSEGNKPYYGATVPPAINDDRPPTNYNLPAMPVPDAHTNIVPQVPTEPVGNTICVGQVVDKISGKVYSGIIYPNGVDKDGINIDKMKILQIDEDEIIPSGTWGNVTVQTEYIDENNSDTVTNYYMQIPVYM